MILISEIVYPLMRFCPRYYCNGQLLNLPQPPLVTSIKPAQSNIGNHQTSSVRCADCSLSQKLQHLS
jgi:hypothetical protein